MTALRITPPDAPPDRGRRPTEPSHYARILVARRGRPGHVTELETMAAWIESQWPVFVRFLPRNMLARLEQIEASPAVPEYAPLAASDAPPPVEPPAPAPAPRPSCPRAVLTIDAWATSAHAWQCGCTHPSAGECGRCSGECMCHVGAPVAASEEKAS